MPDTSALPNWDNEDAFIIGGGPSLSQFDFSYLLDRNVVGCNQAFQLGADVCPVCIFGDDKFWRVYHQELESYGGHVVTNCRIANLPDWVKYIPREDFGLCGIGSGKLAWNGNTGAAAINLSLQLRAKRVYLLGFDCQAPQIDGERRTHWHDETLESQVEAHYKKFREGFQTIAKKLREVFPGREVFNVTDGSSRLDVFPNRTFDEVLNFRKVLSL
jgi:hypothetical protein